MIEQGLYAIEHKSDASDQELGDTWRGIILPFSISKSGRDYWKTSGNDNLRQKR